MTKSSNRKIKILFVCSGNTCRSPMAEAISQFLLGSDYDCSSAGIKVEHPKVHEKAKQAIKNLKLRGASVKKINTAQVTQELIDGADIVFYLGDSLLKNSNYPLEPSLSKLFPNDTHKFFKYAAERDKVPDPYDLDGFSDAEIKKIILTLGDPRIRNRLDLEAFFSDGHQEVYDTSARMMLNEFSPKLPNALNQHGDTPLMAMIKEENFYVALKLLKIPNTDLTIQNADGLTALDLALDKKNEELAGAILNKLTPIQRINALNKTLVDDNQERGELLLTVMTSEAKKMNRSQPSSYFLKDKPGTSPSTKAEDVENAISGVIQKTQWSAESRNNFTHLFSDQKPSKISSLFGNIFGGHSK